MVGYIVLAHKAPDQLSRLLRRLSPAPTFVHIDTRAKPAVIESVVAIRRELPSVHLLPRVRSGWASWGLVEAALRGLRAAQALDVEHIVLLTGQDYPLVSTEEIEEFSSAQRGVSFAHTAPLPYRHYGPDGGWPRVTQWHYPIKGRRVRVPVKRTPPAGITVYRGSQFNMLTRAAARAVVDFVDARPDVVRFYRRTWIPDELFIQTVLHHTVDPDQLVNENLWYMLWPGGAHPTILTMQHASDMRRYRREPVRLSGYGRRRLFARKFDPGVDAQILDEIDSWD